MPGTGIPSRGDKMQSDRTSARDQNCSIFSLHRPDNAVGSVKKIGAWSGPAPPRQARDLGVEEVAPCPKEPALCLARSIRSYASAVFAIGLLARRRAQSVPGVADLMVVDFGRVVRGVEAERLDVEAADGAEQRISGDHPVSLGADQPRPGGGEVLLRVEYVKRRTLARLRFLLHAGERDAGRAHLRLRGGERNLRPLESDPGAQNRGLGLTADELQHDAGLHRKLLGLPDLRGRQPA